MNAELLLAHFDRIGDAPDAVPRLRQFVLELAVRGKLLGRDSDDEPASASLKRIQADIAKRVKAGEIKARCPSQHVDSGEVQFDIPREWCWTRLGALAEIVMGQSPPGSSYNKSGEGIPLINGPVEFSEGPFGTTSVNQYTTEPTNLCEQGDLLLCVRGSTTGRTNIAGQRACIGRGVAAIRSLFADGFVRLYIWRHRASIIAMGRGIAFPSISRQQIENLPMPFPSLAEQHRIVAMVDELMALCDRLEAAQRERENRRDRLAASTHHHLNNGADAEALRSHAKFFIGHLSRITTSPSQIKQLRQTILNLAVRGQLVPQSSNTESALDLLRQIRKEKQDLLDRSILRKVEPSDLLSASTIPFAIPASWAATTLRTVCLSVTDGDHLPPPKAGTGVPFLVIGNVRDKTIRFENSRHVTEEYYASLDSIRRPQSGDILYTLVGSYGIPVHVVDDRRFCVQRHIGILRPCKHVDRRFLGRILETSFVFEQATNCATGIAQKTVPLAGLRKMRIPLPPLAEQQRIVAKVDELMALCDQLESRLTTAQTEGARLLESVLHHSLQTPAQIKHDPVTPAAEGREPCC